MSCRRLLIHARRCYSRRAERAVFLTKDDLNLLTSDPGDHSSPLKAVNPIFTDVQTEALEPIQRASLEADFGRKRIGMVQLPPWLVARVSKVIDESDKRLLRTDALRLYEAFRSTSKMPDTDSEPHTLSYGPRESIAYLAGAMPSTFGAITNILQEIKGRLPDFAPASMVDFGTGPGTAIWAAQTIFDVQKCIGIDLSEDMLRVAESLDPKESEIEFKRYLAPSSSSDLVMGAFALGELPSIALQRSTVEQLWAQTGDLLILTERGTPGGFSNIARARQWILDTGEAHVVAPCPHDKPCPLMYAPEANPKQFWCHFSQRIQRPAFLMKTKHSKRNIEDAKYAYVVLRRGPRPLSLASDPLAPFQQRAYTWPRLIQPPLKKQGHVVMDVCSPEGEIHRMVIAKSQGKVPYRDARKAMWGDIFPHPPKGKKVTRLSEGTVDPEEQNQA